MKIEEAVEILNTNHHRMEKWSCLRWQIVNNEGHSKGVLQVTEGSDYQETYLEEFEAVAIAEKYLRERG